VRETDFLKISIFHQKIKKKHSIFAL